MLYVRIERPDGDQAFVALPPAGLKFGRDADNDVVLDDFGVSRHHAELRAREGAVFVRDLGSRNGTAVGRRVAEPGAGLLVIGGASSELAAKEELELSIGDELHLGSVRVVLGESLGDELIEASPTDLGRACDTLEGRQATGELSPGETLDIAGDHAVALLDFASRFAAMLSGRAEVDVVPDALARLSEFLDAHRVDVVRLVGDRAAVSHAPTGWDAERLPPEEERAAVTMLEARSSASWLELPSGPRLLVPVADDQVLRVVHRSGATQPSTLDRRSIELVARLIGQFIRLLAANEALASANQSLSSDLEAWQRTAGTRPPPIDVIAVSPGMLRTLEEARAAAAATVPVLLTGETGAGKEVVARYVHACSPLAEEPFIALNAAALSDELLLSELFGHRRGAFTGATSDKSGLFELASGGTLFLDEVGELSATAQARLLRVLEDGTFRRVGDTEERRTDARIVAATNRDLASADGTFRSDLFYRLAVMPLRVPPLRERLEDVLPLAARFFARSRAGGGPALQLDVEASRMLLSWDWPGNVRELRNVIERASLLARGPIVRAQDIRFAPGTAEPVDLSQAFTLPRDQALDAFKRAYFERLLLACDWNVARAARAAGMGRRNLYQVIEKHGLERPDAPGHDGSGSGRGG